MKKRNRVCASVLAAAMLFAQSGMISSIRADGEEFQEDAVLNEAEKSDFSVLSAERSIDQATVENMPKKVVLSSAHETINGVYSESIAKPDPVLMLDGVRLVSGVDYSISFANTTKAGPSEAVIEGITIPGTLRIPFEIVDSSQIGTKVTRDHVMYTLSQSGWKVTDFENPLEGKLEIPVYIDDLPVWKVDDQAFKECYKLTSITLPETVRNIGENAFEGCRYLKSVQLPSSLEYISERAFLDCTDLAGIVLPEYLHSIGEEAFANCSALRSIRIPAGCSLHDLAFNNCTGLKTIEFAENYHPESWGYGVFMACTALENVKIPSAALKISGWFHSCTALKQIIVPASVQNLELAFSGCSSLEQVTIEQGVTTIGDSAFNGCTSLKTVSLPDSVTSIQNGAFAHCSSLREIQIPAGVKSIGDGTFYLVEGAFEDCASLKSITLPEKLITIGPHAFTDCKALEKVNFSDRLTNIEAAAFERCTSLKTVSLPDSVMKLNEYAFFGCSQLQTVKLPKDLKRIEASVFGDCEKLETVTLPGASLQAGAGHGIEEIGSRAFSGCLNLASLSVPVSLQKVEKDAFEQCPRLLSVSYQGTKDAWGRIKIESGNNALVYANVQASDGILEKSRQMQRLYNPNSGEHFYTSSAREHDFLVHAGWKDEGIGWRAPAESSIPVFRLYNPNEGDHHYTTDEYEKKALIRLGWKDEGTGWYSDEAESVPLYRLYNPNAQAGSHHYTTSVPESGYLTAAAGWQDEGIGWYGLE